MRRIITAVIAAFLIGLGGIALPADTASAHQWDNYSLIYCTAHKSDPGGHVWVNHSWPYSLQPGLLTYKCTQYDTTVFGNPEHQYFVVRHMPSGAHWRQGGYQHCDLVVCTYH